MLWDNTLLLPLSGLALCLYLSFCRAPKRWKLATLTPLLALSLMTHLMSLVFIVPLAAHALLFRRRWLRENAWLCAALTLGAAALCAPYAAAALRELGGVSAPMPSLWQGWLFPLLGGRFFSGLGFGYFLGQRWPDGWAKPACWASAAAIIFVWHGIWLAVQRARAGWRRGEGPGFDASVVALGVLGLQIVVYGAARVYGHPHYLGPVWLVNLYFLWSGVSALPRGRALAGGAYAAALALSLLAAATSVERTGGTRGLHYGPTLENQLGVARALNRFRPGPLEMKVVHYRLFPQALSTLMDLYDLKGDRNAAPRKLAVVYREADESDGRIMLEAGG
jgi:hypothetical protein